MLSKLDARCINLPRMKCSGVFRPLVLTLVAAASDSTLKQLTTCGVSNTCTLLYFTLHKGGQTEFSYFFVWWKKNFAKGAMANSLPKYATDDTLFYLSWIVLSKLDVLLWHLFI